MSQPTYLPRIAETELSERLNRLSAVLIEGAKACGKTEMALHHCASQVRLDVDEGALATAQIAPSNVLAGPTPRLIDEWQLVPTLWNAVRREADARRQPGQFVLTGSATPSDDATRHTGAGRVGRMRLRTLTLAESGLSSTECSLAGLLSSEGVSGGASPMTLNDMIEEVCHGGWPADRPLSQRDASANVADYVTEIANSDIRTLDGVRRDSSRVRLLLHTLARNTASQASHATLARDVGDITDDTVGDYLRALERLMVLEPLTAWSPVLRSRARLRKAVTHHFVDPAISASLLNVGPDKLRRDLKTFGFLFESLALRDLRVYAGAARAQVHHYRDSSGLEVDAVVDGGYRRWGACEIKLSADSSVIDAAAAQLLKFAQTVDTQSTGEPVFLAVVTAAGYAYARPDGVCVIPLATLGT